MAALLSGQLLLQGSFAVVQQQILVVLEVALTAVLSEESVGRRVHGKLGDEHHHLLTFRKRLLHKVEGRFQRGAGRLLGGVIWGVWHWPLMLLVGYEYGTNYLGAPLLGLVVWCVVCFALNTLLDWLYEKTGCIWVPAIAHGAFNAVAALFTVLTYPADAYYNVLGPTPIGLIGLLPVLAAAVWLTLREMKREEKS